MLLADVSEEVAAKLRGLGVAALVKQGGLGLDRLAALQLAMKIVGPKDGSVASSDGAPVPA